MASEYLKWKYRDVKPDPPATRTAREKRSNWWYYHKWHVVLGAGLLAVALYLTARGLGIGQVKPDYQVAYVGESALPEETAAALETALASLATDCTGDGQVLVRLNQYVMGGSSGEGALYAYAGSTRLMADLEACDSYFFLLEDPAAFQKTYQVLCRLDGSLPEDTDQDCETCYLSWEQCPVLEDLPVGNYSETVLGREVGGSSQELLSGLFVARRGFWTERTCDYVQACGVLWETITRGYDQ